MPDYGGTPNHSRERRPSQGPRDEAQLRERLKAAFGNDYVSFLLDPPRERYEEYLERTKAYVRDRVGAITTHQLRNIFARVKRAKSRHDLMLLRPQLAYVAGRSEKVQMSELVQLLDDLIRQVDDRTLDGFKRFYEAIIAYHKFYDPKGS